MIRGSCEIKNVMTGVFAIRQRHRRPRRPVNPLTKPAQLLAERRAGIAGRCRSVRTNIKSRLISTQRRSHCAPCLSARRTKISKAP